MINDWKGLDVTVMGLGLFGGGLGATEWLLKQGARVTVTDLKTETELRPSVEKLRGAPIRWRLGGHWFEDFRSADVVVVSPAVPRSSPYLKAAEEAGRIVTSEMNLFFERCRGRIVGVTGSNGKTTTAHLTYEILRHGDVPAWLGGNLGRSLLDSLEKIAPNDWVVLELSSFQLEDLARQGLGPNIAIVTNLSPNHLDRHGNMEAYIRAKKNIVRCLRPGGAAVLNQTDPVVWEWRNDAGESRVWGFGAEPGDGTPGTFLERGWLTVWDGQQAIRVLPVSEFSLPGPHNQANALAAIAGAWAAGASADGAATALREFRSLPHRMEFVTEREGVRYYNDSKATTPVAAIAALNSFPERVILLAGGYDKKIPLDTFAQAIVERTRFVVLMGDVAKHLRETIERLSTRPGSPQVLMANGFTEAVGLARKDARSGDVVLLSPGCASYGMFNNYEERGERFKSLVRGAG